MIEEDLALILRILETVFSEVDSELLGDFSTGDRYEWIQPKEIGELLLDHDRALEASWFAILVAICLLTLVDFVVILIDLAFEFSQNLSHLTKVNGVLNMIVDELIKL